MPVHATQPMSVCRQAALPLIDTHTHFDDAVFDGDRMPLAETAYQAGVQHLVLIGYLAKYFARMHKVYQQLNQGIESAPHTGDAAKDAKAVRRPMAHLAAGLHPAYIAQHSPEDLVTLATVVSAYPHIAIGEIGLDTYTKALKTEAALAKQIIFFKAQLDIAVAHQLPVLLHIRKAHAQCLAILKAHPYDAHQLGGIAHSFSGGEQEAKAFVKLGFKLGVTGQVTNPNAKKLQRTLTKVVADYGLACLVLETDCPDMTPLGCQHGAAQDGKQDGKPDNGQTRNVPANLGAVLQALSDLLHIAPNKLAVQLWQNSCDALQVDWRYPSQ